MENISKLNKNELRELLKKLKLLNSLKKSLWNRWIKEFDKINNWVDFYKVEYFNSNYEDLSFLKQSALKAFVLKFWLKLNLEQIEFIQNNNLKWWFRIFLNDNMFDFSYFRFESLLK